MKTILERHRSLFFGSSPATTEKSLSPSLTPLVPRKSSVDLSSLEHPVTPRHNETTWSLPQEISYPSLPGSSPPAPANNLLDGSLLRQSEYLEVGA